MFRDIHERPRHSDEECARLLDRFLLPPGQLLAVLAPEGWTASPLFRCYHPTPEQRRQEAAQLRENFERMFGRAVADRRAAASEAVDDPAAPDDEPTEEEPRVPDPEGEVVDLVGRTLWDIFSDNHTVFDEHGDFDLGSFRASAGFLAEKISVRYRGLGCGGDYLDFYMGTIGIARRADLGPVYRWVFAGLRAAGCDWCYHFPRIYLISFPRESERSDEDWHDPSAAVAADLETVERGRETLELQKELDASYDEAVERAKREPPPAIVQAYCDAYGKWPRGWPPSRTDE